MIQKKSFIKYINTWSCKIYKIHESRTTSSIALQIFIVVFPHCFSDFILFCITESSPLIELLDVTSIVYISTWNVNDISWINIRINMLKPLFRPIVVANKIMQRAACYHNFCLRLDGVVQSTFQHWETILEHTNNAFNMITELRVPKIK